MRVVQPLRCFPLLAGDVRDGTDTKIDRLHERIVFARQIGLARNYVRVMNLHPNDISCPWFTLAPQQEEQRE